MTKIDKQKLKNNIINIDTKMKDLSSNLKKLSENLNEMMNGSSKEPYWNGKAAKKFYERGVGNLKNDIKDYQSSYKKLNEIAVKYEQLVNNDE